MRSDLYKTIYDTMHEGLYVLDKAGRIVCVNRSAQRILGFTEGEMVGEIGHYLFHDHAKNKPDSLAHCPIYVAFMQGLPYVGEEVFCTKQGELIVVEVSCVCIKSEAGCSEYMVLFRDITRQKEQEKRLKELVNAEIRKNAESEIFYNKIFETANLGICLTNKEGRFAVVNPAYCKIYGYSEKELIGEHFTKVVPPQNRETMTALHDAFIAGEKEEIPQEWDVVGREGRQIRIIATAGRLDNIVGGPYKITTITDMTEAYQMRLLQKHQEAMLIQQSKLASMGEMLGAIAHQWRQPLNVINCTTLDMRIKKQLGTLDEAYFNEAIAELSRMTQSMSKTIDDFMNFFRPNKQKTFFELRDCVEYAIGILSAQLRNHAIEVHNEVPKGVRVYGAMGELEQVILNLLSNARDAFEETSTQERWIRLHVKSDTQGVVLVVEDNAGGIDAAIIERIFDPYFTTKGDKQGTGIGLYMCATIMEKSFDGSIRAMNWYNSAKHPMGTQMLLRFPLEENR